MQRKKRFFHQVTHPTKLDIYIQHHVFGRAGDVSIAIGKGFDLYPDYHPRSNSELWAAFYDIAIQCGTFRESGISDVTERSTKIVLSGKINGVRIDKTELHSVIELAKFIEKYGVELDYGPAKEATKDPDDKRTAIHLSGMMSGKRIDEQFLRSEAEVVSFLNAHNSGTTYRAVADDEVLLSSGEVRALRINEFSKFMASIREKEFTLEPAAVSEEIRPVSTRMKN